MFYWGKTMINIKELIPFMKEGWVAMDENGVWYYHEQEPEMSDSITGGYWCSWDNVRISDCFDIAPADDWTKSLIRVKGVK